MKLAKENLRCVIFMLILTMVFMACKEKTNHIYYVSSAGNDQSNGSKNEPFKTLAHAALKLKAGDMLFIRGGEYYETLSLKESGTKDLPIVISNYPEEIVYIFGADKILTEWKPEEQNVWVTDLPDDFSDFQHFQVFKGATVLVEARWPNMPDNADMRLIGEYGPYRAIAQKGTDKEGIVFEGNLTGNLAGGGICTWPGAHGVSAWAPISRKIRSVNGKKILFDKEMTSTSFSGMDPYTPYPDNPFFVFGCKSLLDNENEYYLDETARKLYLISSTNPVSGSMKIKKRDIGIEMDSLSFVTIKGLTVLGASLSATNLNQVVIEQCTFLYPEYIRYPGYDTTKIQGMRFTGKNSSFKHNEVAYCSSSGLFIKGSKLNILNNYIHDIACTGLGAGVIIDQGTEYAWLANNSIVRSGRSHFLCPGGSFGEGQNQFNEKYFKPAKVKGIIMEYNYLQDHNTYTSDCALFYAWNVDGDGTKFRFNYCTETLDRNGNFKYTNGKMDRQIQGLYSDNFCKNMEFSSNIVINQSTGIQANNFNVNIQDYNNTIINPAKEMVATFGYLETPGYMTGSRIYNNTFFTTDSLKNIYLGIHCDKGSFEDPKEVRQEYIKRVSFKKGNAITKRYDLSTGKKLVYTDIGVETDTTFEIKFDQHDPKLRNAESKGNRLYTSQEYGKPSFYENYFKLPNGETLKDYGCEHDAKVSGRGSQ